MLTLLHLKKRCFQCKICKRVIVAESSIVEKNCQIPHLVRQRVADLLTDKLCLIDTARKLRIPTSTVYQKLEQFTFKETFESTPEVMFWDEFSFR